MHVLVVTVVHTPLDARIHRREITALLDAGHRVTFAAPFSAYGVSEDALDARLVPVDVPRASHWRRVTASIAVARLLRAHRDSVDVVVVHDPELLLAVVGRTTQVPVVWDVHEDLASSFGDKPWVPRAVAGLLRLAVRRLERWAERHLTLLLAEEGYADRFRREHVVVPNLPPLPDHVREPTEPRVVYLGRVSRLRGARELLEVGRQLSSFGIRLEVVGPVDPDVEPELRAGADAGHLDLAGFLPNDAALARLPGALAGLSLLHDHPNYRRSLPTKVVEYQAAGVPVITTPLPAAVEVVESAGSGVVVPFRDVDAVVDAVVRLRDDPETARSLGAAGRADAEGGRSWAAVAGRFVAAIEAAAG